MRSLGSLVGMSMTTEVLVLAMFGICSTVFDRSLFDLHSNLTSIWDTAIDPEYSTFSNVTQINMRYMMSSIEIVRGLSTHLYLGLYIVLLWPAIFEERPALLLPWLFVSAVRNIGMSLLTLIAGMYVCASYGLMLPACAHLYAQKLLDCGPSMYMWWLVRNYYKDLKIVCRETQISESLEKFQELNMTPSLSHLRRRRLRTLSQNIFSRNSLGNEADEKEFVTEADSVKRVTSDDLNREKSVETLMGHYNSCDAIGSKRSQFLIAQREANVSEEMSVAEKTARILGLTKSFIEEAKKAKSDSSAGQSSQGSEVKSFIQKHQDYLQSEASFEANPTEEGTSQIDHKLDAVNLLANKASSPTSRVLNATTDSSHCTKDDFEPTASEKELVTIDAWSVPMYTRDDEDTEDEIYEPPMPEMSSKNFKRRMGDVRNATTYKSPPFIAKSGKRVAEAGIQVSTLSHKLLEESAFDHYLRKNSEEIDEESVHSVCEKMNAGVAMIPQPVWKPIMPTKRATDMDSVHPSEHSAGTKNFDISEYGLTLSTSQGFRDDGYTMAYKEVLKAQEAKLFENVT